MKFDLNLPRIVRFGSGVSRELPELLRQLGLSRPLVISDSFHVESGNVDRIVNGALSGARIFTDTVPEPTDHSIETGLAFFHQGDHDCVVGLGGGSAIDSAKAIAVLAAHGGRCRDYQAPHVQDVPGLPIIAVPTTAGTGSEVTRFTVITDEASDEKMLCGGLAFLPTAALVDPDLTATMPSRLTADTGIDAITHAIEAYISRRANPFADGLALEALRLMAVHIRSAFTTPEDEVAREAMMLGSLLAGFTISSSSVALVHGMSCPIGAHFHVPHGLSNAMLLPAVTAYSAPAAPERYGACARAMGVAPSDADDRRACDLLIRELMQLNKDLRVPTPAEYGISRTRWVEMLPLMVRQALGSGSPANNPLIPSPEDIHEIYEQAWDDRGEQAPGIIDKQ